MLSSKIEIFFGKFAVYIIGAVMFLAAFLGAGWYVSNARLEGQRHKANALATQLQVSNASFDSIKGEYQKLTRQLEDNQKVIIGNQAVIKAGVDDANEKNKAYLTLEKELHDRIPQSDCKTPKDLGDAWTKL